MFHFTLKRDANKKDAELSFVTHQTGMQEADTPNKLWGHRHPRM